MPYLRDEGASAVGVDVWYHQPVLPPTQSGRDMAAFVVKNQPNLISADGRRLPFAAGTFDLVVMSFLLHHLPLVHDYLPGRPGEATQLLTEAVRVLRPGGRAVITTFLAEDEDVTEASGVLTRLFGATPHQWSIGKHRARIDDQTRNVEVDVDYLRIEINH